MHVLLRAQQFLDDSSSYLIFYAGSCAANCLAGEPADRRGDCTARLLSDCLAPGHFLVPVSGISTNNAQNLHVIVWVSSLDASS